MIKTVVGDILDATEEITCHQVNCRGVMGAGVAKTLCTRCSILTFYDLQTICIIRKDRFNIKHLIF